MSYTEQEVQAAVEKLLRTSIRRGQGALGNREVGVTFNDYQDAAAGVFILFQNAPYYLVYLGAQRLRKALETQQELVGEFIEVVEAVGRHVTPISNLSPLANARVALDGLLLASGSRTSSFTSIEEVPAYQRFQQNTQKFLDESSKNIRQDGELVRTPVEGRSMLATEYAALETSHEDVVRRVGLLNSAIDDYEALDLPATLVNAILENARDTMQDWYSQLAALPEKDRLKLIRDATLDILAARATVSGFGSLTAPTIFVPIAGEGQVYSDDNHLATPAGVSSTKLGPYALLEESLFLHFTVEGDDIEVEVAGSFVARHEGTVYGPYDVGAPNSIGTYNDQLRLQLLNRTSWGSVDTYDIDFPGGPSSFEAWEVCGLINYDISPSVPLMAEVYPNPLRFGGPVDLEFTGGNYVVTSLSTATDFGALGIIEGGYVLITDTTSANQNSILQVKPSGVGTDTLTCLLAFDANGGWTDETGVSGGKDIRVTDDELPIRLKLPGAGDKAIRWDGASTWTNTAKSDVRETALLNKWGIRVAAEGYSTHQAVVVGDIDLSGHTYPGDVAGLVMSITIDGGTPQSVDLTGFAGSDLASFILELNTQTTGVTFTAQGSTNYLVATSDLVGEGSQVQITSGDLLDKLFTGGAAGVPYSSGPVPSTSDMQLNAATTIGLYPGAEVISRRTTAETVADNVTNSPQAAISKEPRVEAETYFSATAYSGRGRTDPFNFLRVVASLFEQDSLVVTDLTGNAYQFPTTGAATAGVSVGHIIAIRASVDPDDIGLWAAVTAVDDEKIEATFSGPLGDLTDMDIEVGPDLRVPSELDHDASVVVANSPMNDGTYLVRDGGSVPFELEIDSPFPFPSKAANLPIYFDLEVGYFGVTFKSLDETVDTEITVHDNSSDPASCIDRFFSVTTITGYGETIYFQLPAWSRQLNEGDLLELYPTQYDSPGTVIAIASTEEGLRVVRLEETLPTNTPAYDFTAGSEVPFARVRNSRLNTYGSFSTELTDWLDLYVNQETYFRELLRLLNPLAVNTNPTAVQINDAKTHLELLGDATTELDGYLAAYTADVVPQIDTLLSSLLEKGADRAHDVLLEAQFSTFFGMNMDEVSYAGTVQSALKEINREDLPVRKDNRTGRREGNEELLASYEEKDYEYDTSDLDPSEELDLPAGTPYSSFSG